MLVCIGLLWPISGLSAENDEANFRAPLPQVLTEKESAASLKSIDRGLSYLASRQHVDGSFYVAYPAGSQPAITAFACMAFFSRGHLPGVGPYGKALDKAVDFVLSTQTSGGMFTNEHAGYTGEDKASNARPYNHAIALLMVGEACGLCTGERAVRLNQAAKKALEVTIAMWTKDGSLEDGGWRYWERVPYQFLARGDLRADISNLAGRSYGSESDLSVTGWHIASLRSLKNAGFDIPKDVILQAKSFVENCYDERSRTFYYRPYERPGFLQVAMAGAGALCLALCGDTSNPKIAAAVKAISAHDFDELYNFRTVHGHGRMWPYYSCYYASQAAAQAGGEAWKVIFTKVHRLLTTQQQADGSWPAYGGGSSYGTCYSTSLAILSLTPRLQLLPLYQH